MYFKDLFCTCINFSAR